MVGRRIRRNFGLWRVLFLGLVFRVRDDSGVVVSRAHKKFSGVRLCRKLFVLHSSHVLFCCNLWRVSIWMIWEQIFEHRWKRNRLGFMETRKITDGYYPNWQSHNVKWCMWERERGENVSLIRCGGWLWRKGGFQSLEETRG